MRDRKTYAQPKYWYHYPTNVASVNLVVGCSKVPFLSLCADTCLWLSYVKTLNPDCHQSPVVCAPSATSIGWGKKKSRRDPGTYLKQKQEEDMLGRGKHFGNYGNLAITKNDMTTCGISSTVVPNQQRAVCKNKSSCWNTYVLRTRFFLHVPRSSRMLGRRLSSKNFRVGAQEEVC